jgi:predicted amidophosphoribosyltransferase
VNDASTVTAICTRCLRPMRFCRHSWCTQCGEPMRELAQPMRAGDYVKLTDDEKLDLKTRRWRAE